MKLEAEGEGEEGGERTKEGRAKPSNEVIELDFDCLRRKKRKKEAADKKGRKRRKGWRSGGITRYQSHYIAFSFLFSYCLIYQPKIEAGVR